MKALSLWQPWATLIAIGAKKIETRSWATNYRGPLLICSAKRPIDRDTRDWMEESSYFREVMKGDAGRWMDLPLGVAVCAVRLFRCTPTHLLNPTRQEWEFGNFEAGRFAWELVDPKMLSRPIPMRGAQGLFDVPDSVVEDVRRQVRMESSR